MNLKIKLLILPVILLLTTACEKEAPEQKSNATPLVVSEARQVLEPPPAVVVESTPEENSQFNIGNTRYLFNVSNHSPEELAELLQRAELIRETNAEGYEELEIVLVLHGPDINFFRQENYEKHKPIVDLAAKLDAFDIIDMKICETSMSSMGVDRSEVPAFIESVPYAPAEIRRLQEDGYINL